MATRFVERAAAIAALTLLCAAPLPAQLPESADPATTKIDFDRDATGRMTVPVSINGSGPYSFLVDTGAERTVISEELAEELQLGAGRVTTLHSISGTERVETVHIPRLRVSSRTMNVADAPALAATNLGAAGMLGVDTLKRQRVLFDFERQTMTVTPSSVRSEVSTEPNMIIVTGRSRFGRLVLTDASIDGQRVWVIIDTGSQVSIGNDALRRKLLQRNKNMLPERIQVGSVTGGLVAMDYVRVNGLKMGGVRLKDMPIGFADVLLFRKLGLAKRPALLLGMDALSLFDRVAVDFANRTVRFDVPYVFGRDGDTRMAALDPAAGPIR